MWLEKMVNKAVWGVSPNPVVLVDVIEQGLVVRPIRERACSEARAKQFRDADPKDSAEACREILGQAALYPWHAISGPVESAEKWRNELTASPPPAKPES